MHICLCASIWLDNSLKKFYIVSTYKLNPKNKRKIENNNDPQY